MNRSKKVFVVVSILFILATLAIGYDITTKTSFPGSKKLLKESIAPTEPEISDTLKLDSLKQK
ncbi:MAG: hypothetical protein ACJAS3_001750 [Roseivirga sp.]|jgi:hypothetical protein